MLEFNSLIDLFDYIYDNSSYTTRTPATATTTQSKMGAFCPDIKRVTFNGRTTIVWFVDDTRVVVKCSTGDKYDKKTAIVYAIAKRLLGKVKPNREVDGNGFGCYLQKIVDAAFDQAEEEKIAAEKKRAAKAEHLARQEAEKKAAFEKRVEERAKQLLLERAAIDRANEIEDVQRAYKCSCGDNGNRCTCGSKTTGEYVRPNKPFSKFTVTEKREYWRAQNAKRRAK